MTANPAEVAMRTHSPWARWLTSSDERYMKFLRPIVQ